MDVAAKTVVVTGAAGGIGAALAARFVAEGARHVVLVDLKAEVHDVAARCGGTGQVRDLTSAAENTELVEEVTDAYGGIDLFCANAGVLLPGDVEVPEEGWALSWEVNVMTHVWAIQALLPHWRRQGGGYLLQTVSAAGLLTAPGAMPYAVTKHAALALGEALAIEHARDGVRVSCLCPMGVRTPMLVPGDELSDRLLPDAITPEQVADCVVRGLAEERFLILPHPQVADYFQRKAVDHSRWIDSVRKYAGRS